MAYNIGVGSAIVYTLTLNTAGFRRGLQGAEYSLDRFDRKAKGAANSIEGLAVAASLATAAVGGLMAEMARLAANAEETQNLFEVSMGRMGDRAEEFVRRFSDAVGGIDPYQVKGMLGTFNLMIKNMGLTEEAAAGMSEQLTSLAYDMSSLRNIRFDEAFLKIQSGLSGELEPLKRLGIVVSDQLVRQRAVTLGFIQDTNDYLTEAEKVYTRYRLILEQTTADQGDLAKTQTSVTNASRILTDRVKMLGIAIGQSYEEKTRRLLVTLGVVVQRVTNWVDKNKELVSSISTVTLKVMGFTVATLGALIVLKSLFIVVSPLVTILKSVLGVLSLLNTGILGVVFAIGVLLLPLGYVAGLIRYNYKQIRNYFLPAMEALNNAFNNALPFIKSFGNTLKEFVIDMLDTVFDKIGDFIASSQALIVFVRDISESLLTGTIAQDGELFEILERAKNAGLKAKENFLGTDDPAASRKLAKNFVGSIIPAILEEFSTLDIFTPVLARLPEAKKGLSMMADDVFGEGALDRLTNFFDKTSEGTDKLKKQLESVGGEVDALLEGRSTEFFKDLYKELEKFAASQSIDELQGTVNQIVDASLTDVQKLERELSKVQKTLQQMTQLQVGTSLPAGVAGPTRPSMFGESDFEQVRIRMQQLNQEIQTAMLSDEDLSPWDKLRLKISQASEEMTNLSQQTANAMESVGQSIQTNLTDSITRGIIEGQNAEEVLRNFARAVIQDMIRIGVQMLVNFALGKAMQAASLASTTAMATALATALEPAALLASISSFGAAAGVGKAALAAAMGDTSSAGSGLGGSGSIGLSRGTSYIPNTGLYQLHQGEKVVPAYDTVKERAGTEKDKIEIVNLIVPSHMVSAIAADVEARNGIVNIVAADRQRNGVTRRG